MSKVISSLLSGKYSLVPPTPTAGETPSEEETSGKPKRESDDAAQEVLVAPRMLKHLIGRGHAEFSTGRQQDAAEYMQHVLEVSGEDV